MTTILLGPAAAGGATGAAAIVSALAVVVSPSVFLSALELQEIRNVRHPAVQAVARNWNGFIVLGIYVLENEIEGGFRLQKMRIGY
jgi:hypothetical protein